MKTWIAGLLALSLIACGHNGKDGSDGHNGNDGKTTIAGDNSDGGLTGGGGDEYVQEIKRFQKAIVDYLRVHPMKEVSADTLEAKMRVTVFNFQDSLTLDSDGKPRSAINYPEKSPPEIDFSRTDLDKIRAEKDRLIRLIFHEYLGLLKIDDLPDYAISNQLNAAEIARQTSVQQGTFVPTRLLVVDMSKVTVDCSHGLELTESWNHLQCRTKLLTERLITSEVLKMKCTQMPNDTLLYADYKGPASEYHKLEALPEYDESTGQLTLTVDLVEPTPFMAGNSPTANAKFRDTTQDEFRKIAASCTIYTLLYPSADGN